MKLTPVYLLAASLLLGAGRVETRDGKTIDGDVSFGDGAVTVRSAAETKVPWDAVARVTTRVADDGGAAVVAAAGAKLPAGWKAQDVGGVKYPGSTACDEKGAFAMTASGWGAWGGRDSFQFAWRPLKGDGQVIARVSKLDLARGPVVAGVMIRGSLAPDAPMASACLYPSGEVRLNRRPQDKSSKEFKTADDPAAPPQTWVRLTRRGDEVIGYRSADGKFWQRVDHCQVAMGEDVLVGACAWTTGNDWSGAAVVDSVGVVPGTPRLSYFPGHDPMVQGIVLRDGNMIAATIVSFDPAAGVKYERDGKAETLPTDQVARLVFNPVPPDAGLPSADKAGVLLASGDFIEGDVTAVSLLPVEWPRKPQLKATVRSVVFAARSFEIARDVIAVDLGPVAPAAASYEVRTADGSLIRAKAVALKPGAVVVDGAAVANVVGVKRL